MCPGVHCFTADRQNNHEKNMKKQPKNKKRLCEDAKHWDEK